MAPERAPCVRGSPLRPSPRPSLADGKSTEGLASTRSDRLDRLKPRLSFSPCPESLVKKDGDKLILLQKPVDQAALEVNPTIKDDATKAKIAEYLADRRARFENVIIENVDLAEKLYNGAMDNIDFTDRKQIGEFNSMVKPLTPPVAPANMGAELTKRGVVTDLQKRFNDKIAKEYNDARNKALREGNVAGEDKNANAKNIIRIYMQQVIEEQMMIYESLMVETSKGLAKTLPQIGLDTQAAAKAMDALKSIKGSANADIGRGMKDVMAGLTLDQKKGPPPQDRRSPRQVIRFPAHPQRPRPGAFFLAPSLRHALSC
jgi:hypothetical protein